MESNEIHAGQILYSTINKAKILDEIAIVVKKTNKNFTLFILHLFLHLLPQKEKVEYEKRKVSLSDWDDNPRTDYNHFEDLNGKNEYLHTAIKCIFNNGVEEMEDWI